jgi:hypothetical protein
MRGRRKSHGLAVAAISGSKVKTAVGGIMKPLKTLWTVAALLSLCGCQSLTVLALKSFDPKPYSLPVAAQQLAVIPIPAAMEATDRPTAEVNQAVVSIAPAAGELPTILDAAPEPEPVRTDIHGRGDGLMVDDRVVITAHKEVAHRVPNYSREQVAAMVCARRGDGSPGRLKAAQQALDMTLFAYDVRNGYLAGQLSAKDSDNAERKRQDAVGALAGNSMLFGMFGGRSKKGDLPKPALDGLVLENVDLYTFNENGRPVMAVSGIVHNTTSKRAEPPPLTLAAIDEWEFILAGQTSLLPFKSLEPGEARPFEIRFHNPPDTTYEVYVHFVPPFEYRLRRECDLTDLASDKAAPAPRSAATATTVTSPTHTASELNLLTSIYRNEAESAWNLRACGNPGEDPADDPNKPQGAFKVAPGGGGERRSVSISINLGKFNRAGLCAAWSRRLPWRESFELGEATDEAWGAMLAADEMKRRRASGLATQVEVDNADDALRRDYAAFRALGAKTLARAGGSVEGVEIVIASSNFGYDQVSKAFDGADISRVGFYVDVAGTLRNQATTPRQIGALMLALVDRLEQPLLTFRLDDEIALGPGETRQFEHRVYFSDPVRRKDAKDPPPWQVRVGAVGQQGQRATEPAPLPKADDGAPLR